MLKELNLLFDLNKKRYSRLREQINAKERSKEQIQQEILNNRLQIRSIQRQIHEHKQGFRQDIVTQVVNIDFVKSHQYNTDKLLHKITSLQDKINMYNEKLRAIEAEIKLLKIELRKFLVKEEKYNYLLNEPSVVGN